MPAGPPLFIIGRPPVASSARNMDPRTLGTKWQRVATLVGIAGAIAGASVGGIAVRALGYPAEVPRAATLALTWFAEPGLTIWWFALGGAFQSFPSNTLGIVVAVVANSVFWCVLARLGMGLVNRLLRRSGSRA